MRSFLLQEQKGECRQGEEIGSEELPNTLGSFRTQSNASVAEGLGARSKVWGRIQDTGERPLSVKAVHVTIKLTLQLSKLKLPF